MKKKEIRFDSSLGSVCSIDKLNNDFGLNLDLATIIYDFDKEVKSICDRLGYSRKKSIKTISYILKTRFSNMEHFLLNYSVYEYNSIIKICDICHKMAYSIKYGSFGHRIYTYYPVYVAYQTNYSNEIVRYIIESFLNKNGYFKCDSFKKLENYFEKYHIEKDFKLSKTDKVRSLGMIDVPVSDIPLLLNGKINSETLVESSKVNIYTYSFISIYIESGLETEDINEIKSIYVPLEAVLNNDFSLVEDYETSKYMNQEFVKIKQKDLPISKTPMWMEIKKELSNHRK